MILLVMSNLYQIQPSMSRPLSFPNVHYEHVFKIVIGSFSMSIHFWVVCIFQPFISRQMSFSNVHSEHVFKILIGSFCLSICILIICIFHTSFSSTQFEHFVQYSVTIFLSLSQINFRNNPLIHKYFFNKQINYS